MARQARAARFTRIIPTIWAIARPNRGRDFDVAFDAGHQYPCPRDKRNQPEIVHRLERTRPQDVAISSVVGAELWTRVMKSRERQRNEQALSFWPSSRFSIGLAKPPGFTEKFTPRWKPRADQSVRSTCSLPRTPFMRAPHWRRGIATNSHGSKVCELKVGTEMDRAENRRWERNSVLCFAKSSKVAASVATALVRLTKLRAEPASLFREQMLSGRCALTVFRADNRLRGGELARPLQRFERLKARTYSIGLASSLSLRRCSQGRS